MDTTKIQAILSVDTPDISLLMAELKGLLGKDHKGDLATMARKLVELKPGNGINAETILNTIESNRDNIDVYAFANEIRCSLTDVCDSCGCRC